MQQSNQNNTKILWLVFTAAMAVATILLCWFFYSNKPSQQQAQEEPENFITYNAFGIDVPGNYTIHGIDVSAHNQKIGWKAVKQMNIKGISINFAFVKATEGLEDVDKRFSYNWQKLAEHNITKGAYLFFLATKSGKLQAENFIKTVTLKKGDLPPVVDIEELYGVKPDSMKLRVLECLQTLETHYGVKPIVYSYVDFYEKYLGEPFNDYPLWIAHYFEPHKPRITRKWHFWQHSEKGRVNGIRGKVDFNVFYGSQQAFNNLLIQ
jgi:lysozyme